MTDWYKREGTRAYGVSKDKSLISTTYDSPGVVIPIPLRV
jgi:hypothetical protein